MCNNTVWDDISRVWNKFEYLKGLQVLTNFGILHKDEQLPQYAKNSYLNSVSIWDWNRIQTNKKFLGKNSENTSYFSNIMLSRIISGKVYSIQDFFLTHLACSCQLDWIFYFSHCFCSYLIVFWKHLNAFWYFLNKLVRFLVFHLAQEKKILGRCRCCVSQMLSMGKIQRSHWT